MRGDSPHALMDSCPPSFGWVGARPDPVPRTVLAFLSRRPLGHPDPSVRLRRAPAPPSVMEFPGVGSARDRPYTVRMECRALVTGREGETVRVRVSGSDCAECGGCGIFSRRGGEDVEFTVLEHGAAREGDVVLLEIPGRAVLASFFIAFGLPLLAMAATYLVLSLILLALAGVGHQGAAVAAAVVTGGLSFWWSARLVGRKSVRPRVVAVLGKGVDGAGGDTGDNQKDPRPVGIPEALRGPRSG